MRIPQVSDRMKEAPVQALRATFAGIGQLLLAADRLRNRSDPPNQAGPTAAQPVNQAGKGPAAQPPRQATKPSAAQRGRQGGKTSAPQRGRQGGKTSTTSQQQPSRWRSLDETGNVRLLSPNDIDEELSPRAGLPAEPPAASLLVEPEAPSLPAEPGASLQIGEPSGRGSVLTGEPEPAMVADPAAAQDPVVVPEPAHQAALPVPGYDSLSIASLRARLRNLDVAQLGVLADYERAGRARSDVLTMFERRIAKLETEA